MLDDVLDVSGPFERTGKARGTDLLDGTVNLPLIVAIRRDPSLAELDLHGLDPAGAEAACDRIAATGALDEVRERARAAIAAAKGSLDSPDVHRRRPDGARADRRRAGRALLLDTTTRRAALRHENGDPRAAVLQGDDYSMREWCVRAWCS